MSKADTTRELMKALQSSPFELALTPLDQLAFHIDVADTDRLTLRNAIACGCPRHPRHGVVAESARRRDVLVAVVLIEAARQVADDFAVLGRHQHDVEFLFLPIARRDRHQIT